MGERDLRVPQLGRRVGIAVEGQDAACGMGASGEHMVEILARRVAIDFNRHASSSGLGEHRIPVRDDASAGTGHAPARMGKDPHVRVTDRGEHARGLVLTPAQPRVRGGQHDVERCRLVEGQVQLAGSVDVGLDPLQEVEPVAGRLVDAVDGLALLCGLGHRHAAGNRQAVRMVGDRRVPVAACQAGLGNLVHRRRAVAPFRMHLQVAAVVVWRRPVEGRVAQDAEGLGAAEDMLPQASATSDVRLPAARLDGTFNGR